MFPPNRQLKKLWEIVLEMSSGFACNKNYERLWWYVHLRTHNISLDWTLNFDLIVEIDPKKVDIKKNYIQKWDILFNNTNSKELVWKTALVDKNYPYAYSNHITKFQLKEGYSPKYIVFFLNYLWGRGYFQEKCNKWIWQAWFNNSMLKEIQIPLPPLEEQKKIVAYLDELNATITKLKAEYQSQLTALDEMRNSSLDLAFWWSREREREWNLNNWKWVKLGEIGEIITWTTPSKNNSAFWNGNIPFIKPPHLWSSNPIFKSEENLTNAGEAKAKKIPAWAIMVCCIGSLGKVWIAWTDLCTNQQINSIIFDSKKVLSKYGYYFSTTLEKQMKKIANQAVVQIINKSQFSEIKIPLPDLETQAKIVTHLDQVHQHITSLKAQVAQQIQHCDELWQSSLEQALSQGVK